MLAAVLLLALCLSQFAAAEGIYGADTDSLLGSSGWGYDMPSNMTAAPQMNAVFYFSHFTNRIYVNRKLLNRRPKSGSLSIYGSSPLKKQAFIRILCSRVLI
jgi:hypothetical protein